MPRWVVLKFGGTSVSSRENWERIAEQLQQRIATGLRPIVVCSAFSQVSNTLESLLKAAVHGQHHAILETLEATHRAHASDLGVDPKCIEPYLESLRRISEGVSLVQEGFTPYSCPRHGAWRVHLYNLRCRVSQPTKPLNALARRSHLASSDAHSARRPCSRLPISELYL